jgi:hypothetical protein
VSSGIGSLFQNVSYIPGHRRQAVVIKPALAHALPQGVVFGAHRRQAAALRLAAILSASQAWISSSTHPTARPPKLTGRGNVPCETRK